MLIAKWYLDLLAVSGRFKLFLIDGFLKVIEYERN